MKLATYRDGSRDGQLIVVSSDLTMAHHASAIVSRLQQALDDWNFFAPQLHDLAQTLELGKARHAFPFEPRMCMAPLPRAFRVADVVLAAAAPARWLTLPGDALADAHAAVPSADGPWGLAPRLVLATGDVPRGAGPEQALDGVRLLMLAGLWSVRPTSVAEAMVVPPTLAFAPVAVTPDELGRAGLRGRALPTLRVRRDGEQVVLPADPMALAAAQGGALLAALARPAGLRAGTLVGLGGGDDGAVVPPAAGAHLAVEALTERGESVFGALVQDGRVAEAQHPGNP
jgi:fumarylacetoacetate (FAA) hydrolase